MTDSNLRRDEAAERARLLSVDAYEVTLDLTGDDRTFRSTSTVHFRCAEPGTGTFIEITADAVHTATLNGAPLDLSGFDGERLPLRGLAEDNELVVDAQCVYSRTGEGLHRFVDPVDGGVYLYTQFESYDAHRVYACFDQPDLKATFRFLVDADPDWTVVSNAPVEQRAAGRTTFATTPRMSTYITALVAGPYYEVRAAHDGPGGVIDLGLFCRRSLAQHLDPDELFTLTRQGFDFFHRVFDYPYPFGKYDQLFVPEFNAGAMENAGCVTFLEDYVFRSKVTDAKYERRAETILHEMAHMWFGDLVTMRWWDDLWLNESFATYMSVLAQVSATRYQRGWTTFANTEKTWALRQDQLPSTHPIAADVPDIDTVRTNFDGITYAKGASVLKQLVAWVGQEEFLAGLRVYFRRHEFANTSLADLLAVLEDASGRDLSAWSAEWLSTAGVNTLRAEISTDDDGTMTRFAIRQEAPASHPTLRSHRVAVGLYNADPDGRLVRTERVELDVVGALTEVPKLVGLPRPALLLLNDDDLAYAKIRLDEVSLATVGTAIATIAEPLPRALCWAAAWDMTRDAEMPARAYLDLVLAGAGSEDDIGVVQSLLAKADLALTSYGDPAALAAGRQRLADTALALLRAAPPGSDSQLAYAHAFAANAGSPEHLAVLGALFDGTDVVAGLEVDTDLRWTLLTDLVAGGVRGAEDVAAELDRDRTASGEKRAATALSSQPTAAAKAAAWAAVVESTALSNHLLIATLDGFYRADQLELLRPYAARFFDVIADVWRTRSYEVADSITQRLFPALFVEPATVEATDRYLDAHPDAPPALRRALTEGRDGVQRALRARALDIAAGATAAR